MNTEFGAPYSAVDVILLPGIVFLAAVFFRFLSWNLTRTNKSGRAMKICAYLSVVAGLWIAFSLLRTMYFSSTGFMYMKSIGDMFKVRVAHYLAIALPILTLIGFIVWDRVEKKLGRPIGM